MKWDTLRHNGVLFPPEYTPHGIKMLYDGRPVDLTPEQEEVTPLAVCWVLNVCPSPGNCMHLRASLGCMQRPICLLHRRYRCSARMHHHARSPPVAHLGGSEVNSASKVAISHALSGR